MVLIFTPWGKVITPKKVTIKCSIKCSFIWPFLYRLNIGNLLALAKWMLISIPMCVRFIFSQSHNHDYTLMKIPGQSKYSTQTPTSKPTNTADSILWEALLIHISPPCSSFDDPTNFLHHLQAAMSELPAMQASLRLNKIEKQLLKMFWNVMKMPTPFISGNDYINTHC